MLKVRHFSVIQPPLVVIWQNIRGWTDVKVFALLSTLALTVAPEIGLAAKTPGTYKVIDLLELIHALESTLPNEACPETVPVGALGH